VEEGVIAEDDVRLYNFKKDKATKMTHPEAMSISDREAIESFFQG
jgi:hypothetical protein